MMAKRSVAVLRTLARELDVNQKDRRIRKETADKENLEYLQTSIAMPQSN